MGIATVDVLLMHCLEWTSHVSVHVNLKVPNVVVSLPVFLYTVSLRFIFFEYFFYYLPVTNFTLLSDGVNRALMLTLLYNSLSLSPSPSLLISLLLTLSLFHE